VPPKAFRPVPKVHSAVIDCQFCEEPRCSVEDEVMLHRLVRIAFGQRRKMLRNSLQGMLAPECRQDLPDITARAGIDLTLRPETLGLEEFAALSDEFSRYEVATKAAGHGEAGE
jgi:16S rRNA (adenine1518-N6/adenine1519-N6)-dimethyltransferase